MLKFLGIGAQKAGTTWLYENLRKHPKIYFPGGKEIHFWDNDEAAKSPENYKNLFMQEGMFGGDITPAYSTLNSYRVTQIHKYFPDVKIIFLIRDPRERAWSSARMALRRAELMPYEASRQWFIDHFSSEGSRLRGDYLRTLAIWASIFSMDSIAVVRFESIYSQPKETINKILNHVCPSLLNYGSDNLCTANAEEKVFEGVEVSLPSELRDFLDEMYREKINDLENYLGNSGLHMF